MTAAQILRQRADYTHKHNLKTGRHGWLRLTPAYSVKIVEEIISHVDGHKRIYDPFCGTSTTALSAAYHGHHGITTDINPFLVWLGQAKTAHYDLAAIEGTRHACGRALELVRRSAVKPTPNPPLHNIDRWWSPASLEFLTTLHSAIDAVTSPASPQRTLLLVAFCRTLIAVSNAAFNHQSMSFKDTDQIALALDMDLDGHFAEDVRFVLHGAADNPEGDAEIVLGDARNPALSINEPVDLVITSPPYANRMSYIRELRPYMYWLGFLVNGRDAGEMDWQAIGGTWGMATSRLVDWKPSAEKFSPDVLDAAVERIAHADNKNGKLLSNYVAKYFDDMWAHFQALRPVLAHGAKLHYIVGNSTFYAVLLPVEEIYAAMLERLGFANVECRAIRKRNSKKELIEFDVTARWQG
jgi:D12 class N6 adenine-specific DNA methyltransferase